MSLRLSEQDLESARTGGALLREAVERQGLSIRAFGRLTGVHAGYLIQLMDGKSIPRAHTGTAILAAITDPDYKAAIRARWTAPIRRQLAEWGCTR